MSKVTTVPVAPVSKPNAPKVVTLQESATKTTLGGSGKIIESGPSQAEGTVCAGLHRRAPEAAGHAGPVSPGKAIVIRVCVAGIARWIDP